MIDPAELWDRYCEEVPAKRRSPQGAMAFAVDALTSAPPQADGVREAIYECASIADKYDDCGGAFIAEKIRALALEGKQP